MAKSIEEIKKDIISYFPGLSADPYFDVTSKNDPQYNCIAWAYNYNDRWMEPIEAKGIKIEGKFFWPQDVPMSYDISAYIIAFQNRGYSLCDNWEHEEGFQKIALYVRPDNNTCLHASREHKSGIWVSKLGEGQDIEHGNPYLLEGKSYGKVYCFMERKNP